MRTHFTGIIVSRSISLRMKGSYIQIVNITWIKESNQNERELKHTDSRIPTERERWNETDKIADSDFFLLSLCMQLHFMSACTVYCIEIIFSLERRMELPVWRLFCNWVCALFFSHSCQIRNMNAQYTTCILINFIGRIPFHGLAFATIVNASIALYRVEIWSDQKQSPY